MVHPSKPPLPPSRPYHQPLNYLEYVKDSNPFAHVRIFKAAIKTNTETYWGFHKQRCMFYYKGNNNDKSLCTQSQGVALLHDVDMNIKGKKVVCDV